MSASQFIGIPTHLKPQDSANINNERVLDQLPMSSSRSRTLRIRNSSAIQVFHALQPGGLRRANLPKRPLNSWMAFRCQYLINTRIWANSWLGFYARIFTTLQQKDTSGHLTKLWQQDPFKAKWTIVARGYSSIRDHVGKSNAPLDIFLKLACPVIGIIGVEDYLEKMKWFVKISPDGHISLHQGSTPNIEVFESHFMHTSMTERDVINFVASQGYITQKVADTITASRPGRVGRNLRYSLYPQESLLASRPMLPTPMPAMEVRAAIDPVEQMPYQWMGSMSDLYNPGAGSVESQGLVNNDDTWNMSNFSNPLGFEELFAGMIQDGYATHCGK